MPGGQGENNSKGNKQGSHTPDDPKGSADSLHVVAPVFLALCWSSDVDLNDRLLMLYRWVWLPSYIGAQGHYAYTWHQYLSS